MIQNFSVFARLMIYNLATRQAPDQCATSSRTHEKLKAATKLTLKTSFCLRNLQ